MLHALAESLLGVARVLVGAIQSGLFKAACNAD
jgi:hypothetical protein